MTRAELKTESLYYGIHNGRKVKLFFSTVWDEWMISWAGMDHLPSDEQLAEIQFLPYLSDDEIYHEQVSIDNPRALEKAKAMVDKKNQE